MWQHCIPFSTISQHYLQEFTKNSVGRDTPIKAPRGQKVFATSGFISNRPVEPMTHNDINLVPLCISSLRYTYPMPFPRYPPCLSLLHHVAKPRKDRSMNACNADNDARHNGTKASTRIEGTFFTNTRVVCMKFILCTYHFIDKTLRTGQVFYPSFFSVLNSNSYTIF